MSAKRRQHTGHQIGVLINDRRVAAGLTQRELAEAAGVSLGALRDLEQGRTSFPRWSVVHGLAAVLGLDEVRLAGIRRAVPTGIRFEVLGPLTVWRDGGEIALGSVLQRAVLGFLVLHQGTSLDRDTIIDALWGQRPPATVVTELQGYICRLRKLLGAGYADGGSVISRIGLGYRLTADGDQLDAVAFDRVVAQAGHALDGGHPLRSCTLCEQALSLWRGEVLADIDLLRQHPAVASLACRHSDAVLLYAVAAEAAGASGRVLPHLRGLCAREPFNEQAHASMMLALAATGQQAAALKVFTELRRRLDDELGMPPSPLLAKAQVRVLRQQPGDRLATMREGGSRTICGGCGSEWEITAEVDPLVGHMTDTRTEANAGDVIPVLVCGEPGVSAVIARDSQLGMVGDDGIGAVGVVESGPVRAVVDRCVAVPSCFACRPVAGVSRTRRLCGDMVSRYGPCLGASVRRRGVGRSRDDEARDRGGHSREPGDIGDLLHTPPFLLG